ncbi:MAG TPA: helix-turn-helix domain-containing protein [Chthonomonadaceae bacterium]|nr:helix-turn-helix domain-containing protein [Chthonomonadaceae bacterium]
MPIQSSETLLVSVAEAARLLSVSERTIRRMIADDRLPAVRITSDAVRIARASLDALITHSQPTQVGGTENSGRCS